MIKLNKSLQLVGRTIAIGILVSAFWISSLTNFQTGTMALASDSIYIADLAREDSAVARFGEMRVDAVEDCRKYLVEGDKDTVADLERPLDKMGNDRLVGALKVTENPEPTVAEVEFKRCLEQKGVAPQP